MLGRGVEPSEAKTWPRMLPEDCNCTVRLMLLLTETLPLVKPARLVLGSTAETEKLPARTLLKVKVPSAWMVPLLRPPNMVWLSTVTVDPLTKEFAPSGTGTRTRLTPFKVPFTVDTW